MLGAGLFVISSVAGEPAPAMFGAYSLVLAAILWLRQSRSVQIILEDRGMRVLRDGSWIPYESVRSITVENVQWSGAPPSAPLVIPHAAGCLVLPPQLSVTPAKLYECLAQRVPPQPPPACPPELADYHAEQVRRFGSDKVALIGRRGRARTPGIGGRGIFVMSLIITAIAWALMAHIGHNWFDSPDERDDWVIAAFVIGIVAIAFSVAAYVISWSRDTGRRKAGDAAIVIGPAGMALKQGDMMGALRWDEVTGVTHGRHKQLFVAVPGARITVMDLYERSLSDIAAMIRRNLG